MENENMNGAEDGKQQNGHNVSIALIQKDIQYMRESMSKIENNISLFDKNFARKDELVEFEKRMIQMDVDMKKEIALKVNKEDFDPIKNTLGRINWMVIAGVIVALLALVINTGK